MWWEKIHRCERQYAQLVPPLSPGGSAAPSHRLVPYAWGNGLDCVPGHLHQVDGRKVTIRAWSGELGNPADRPGSILSRADDGFQVAPGVGVPGSREKQIGLPEHARERVVYLVRHASRHGAQRSELL